jgi:hypothetical protein
MRNENSVKKVPLTPNVRNRTDRECVAAFGCGGFGGDVPAKIRDAQYWQDRAEEARLQAEEMTHPPARREMLQIAAGYRRLAEHAQERTARKKSRA